LPMLGACFIAMLVPILFGNPPIYDSLREDARQREKELPPQTIPDETAATGSGPR
jgi:hypothetical protein